MQSAKLYMPRLSSGAAAAVTGEMFNVEDWVEIIDG